MNKNWDLTPVFHPCFSNTNFKMPVVYYSTLMSVAYGGSGKDATLDGQVIKAKQLEEIASK